MENVAIEIAGAAETRAVFTIEAGTLHQAAKFLAGKVTERRNTIPILACVLIAADPAGTVTLTATDLDLQASIRLAADVESPGSFAVDVQALADTLGKAKKGCELVTITDAEPRAVLKAGRSRFNIPRLPVDDFPVLRARESNGALPAFTMPAAQFLADCKALAPCIGREESRYYLNGLAIQPRDIGEGERLYIVATDGHNMGVAARALPDDAGEWEGAILPHKASEALVAAAKIAGEAETVAVSFPGLFVIGLGNVTLTAKAIDGTFPDWTRLWTGEGALTPTEATGDAPMLFPDLMPGAPTGAMDSIAKAAGAPIAWRTARSGFIGAANGDADLQFGCMRGQLGYAGRKGFFHAVGGHDEAERYLLALAETRGLPNAGEIEGRCWEINYNWGECSLAAINGEAAWGEAKFEAPKLQYSGGRIVGLTIAGKETRRGYRETVTDWETLSERTVWHEYSEEPVQGSYSILMPADGPQLAVIVDSFIDGPDGHRYPVAVNESAIHLSKDQVRALIGESCFETMPVTLPDGRAAFILKWLWDQSDSRFLIVGKDGRAPAKLDALREYVTRAELDAVNAGEPIPVASAPIVEIEAPVEAESPAERVEEAAPPATLAETPAIDCSPALAGQNGQVEADASPLESDVAAILARIDALEASLATLPAESNADTTCAVEIVDKRYEPAWRPATNGAFPGRVGLARFDGREWAQGPGGRYRLFKTHEAARAAAATMNTPTATVRCKRTPAHERAIRRAWAMRAERNRHARWHREYQGMANTALIDASQAKAKRRRAVQQARRFSNRLGAWERVAESLRAQIQDGAERLVEARANWKAEERRSEDQARRGDLLQAKRRRSTLLAYQRTRELVAVGKLMHERVDGLTQRNAVLEAELVKLRADIADPLQPERASDIAQLMRERDQARTALSAVTVRAERAEEARDKLADAMDLLVGRVARAEAAVRAIEAKAA